MTRHKDWTVVVDNNETGDSWTFGPYFEDQARRLAERVVKRCKNGLYTAHAMPLETLDSEQIAEWVRMDREGTSVQDW